MHDRCWAPSNFRVSDDIAGWEVLCDKIIEAKGCIVPDEIFPYWPSRTSDLRRGGTKDKADEARSEENHSTGASSSPRA